MVAGGLARLGAALVSADQLAREIVLPGSPVLRKLVDQFGQQILLESGELNREELGRIIFADEKARNTLNLITHPAIAALAVERLRQLKQRTGIPLVVYEAPLLFEAGAEERVDRILLVKIDPQIQLKRLMAREQIDEAAACQRIAAQMPQEEKIKLSDEVIDNSGTVEESLRQVELLWGRLVIGESGEK